MIRNLKIYGKLIAPYILCAGVVVGGNKLAGNGYPFIIDNVDYDYIKCTYTPIASEKEEKIQGEIPENNELFLYTKWTHDYIDNDYKRSVDYYEDVEHPYIIELLDFGNLDIKDILGTPDKTYTESRKRMDEFDFLINQEGYRYITYKDEQGIVSESKKENQQTTLQEILEFGLLSSIIAVQKGRKKKLSYRK